MVDLAAEQGDAAVFIRCNVTKNEAGLPIQ
jgi:hypothetical protein